MKAFMSVPSHIENKFARERAAWAPEVLSANGGRPEGSAAAMLEARRVLGETEPKDGNGWHKDDYFPLWWLSRDGYTPVNPQTAVGSLAEALAAFVEG